MNEFMTVEQARASVRQCEEICKIRGTVQNVVRLSNCYFILGAVEEALKLAHLAFEKDPNNPAVVVNLGLMMNDVGAHDDAFKCFSIAYNDLEDRDWYTKLAYSEALLRRGNWEDAWPIWDTCRVTKEGAALAAGIPIGIKEWDGKKEPESLLVIDEGGIGDRFAYSRYLLELSERQINWTYFPMPENRAFFERASWCKGHLAEPKTNITNTHWTTVYSLPANLMADKDSVPKFPEPIFSSARTKLKYKIGSSVKSPVVGLCWNGNEERHGGRKVHSLSEGQAMRLICKTDHLVCWINLNWDCALPLPVENPRINDLEDLAGLISNMKEVVSIDSGPAYLSSAMDIPTTVLLPSNTDWKFLKDDCEESPFLPGVKLLRNGPGGGIEKAIDKAIEHIVSKYSRGRITLVS